MIKPVIIYNRKDLVANHFYELMFQFYTNIILIDDMDIFSEDYISELQDKLSNIEDDDSTLNLLFFVKYDSKQFNSILELNLVNQYRVNFVFYKVPYNEGVKRNFKEFNSRFKGTTVFSWILGERDSNDNLISSFQLNTAFFSWHLLLSSGALSFVSGKDIFYDQQNLRDKDNHVFVLKSRVLFNSNLLDLLESIQRGWSKSLKDFSEEKKTGELFNPPAIQKKIDEGKKIIINDTAYPTYKSIGNFKSISEFEKLIKDFVYEFETDYLTPKIESFSNEESIYYKNEFESILKSSFDTFKNSLKTNFLGSNNFRFNLVKSYISNTINNLQDIIKEYFSFELEDIASILLTKAENEVVKIVKTKKDITRWMSFKNKKRFILYTLISALVLMLLILVIILNVNFEISFNIITVIIVSCIAISGGFWYWRYSVGMVKLKKLQLKNIRNLNVKMHKTVDSYLETISFNLSRFIKTHWYKKLSSRMIINLQLLQNGFNSLFKELNSINEDLDKLVDGKKGSAKLNVDVNEIKKIIYEDYMHEVLVSNSSNINNLKNKLINGLFKLLNNKLKEKQLEFDDLNLSDFARQEFFVDNRFLINVKEGITSPLSKGRFVIKPTNYEISNVNLDNLMMIDKYDSVLIGEYFIANLD